VNLSVKTVSFLGNDFFFFFLGVSIAKDGRVYGNNCPTKWGPSNLMSILTIAS
jgi:hypothetical protein